MKKIITLTALLLSISSYSQSVYQLDSWDDHASITELVTFGVYHKPVLIYGMNKFETATDTVRTKGGKYQNWIGVPYSIKWSDSSGNEKVSPISSIPISTILGYTPYNGATNPNNYINTSTAASIYQTLNNLQTDLTSSSTKYPSVNAVNTGLATKQATLVSQTNIKSINNNSLLGSGDLSVAERVTNSGNTPEGTGTGTAYTLTQSSAKIDFGTSDPTITIPEAGTYLIFTNIKIEYSGLTTVLQTCNFKLRRTNNTATDLTGAVTNVPIGAATLLTGTGPDTDMKVVKYTTTNNNDVIELWGNRQNGIGITGSINVSESSVLAIRIY